jgi:hypothetical protein
VPFSAPFFQDAQLVDIIRFCGFPSYSFFGWVFEEDYATLTLRLQNMSLDEATALITNFLTPLYMLEKAVVDASCNLDTDQAAVWKHNKNEVADRNNLYYLKRRELCAYIGVKPGRGLGMGASVIRT